MQSPSRIPTSQNIIQAFRVLSNPANNPLTITAANQYLNECQKYPKFPLALIQLYSTSPQPFVQLQSILLLLNIIKRNWQTKRGRGRNDESQPFESEKQTIRKEIIQIYPLYNLSYVKHINQTLKFLARQDYPAKYPELHEFILQSLNTLYTNVLSSEEAIKQQHFMIVGLLSTVKIITKEYASKRLSHSEEAFNVYITEVIKISMPISQKCHQLIVKMWETQIPDQQVTQVLVESAKKIDKIILYCLMCMPNTLQYASQVQKIFQMCLNNISVIDSLITTNPKPQFNAHLESYIAGVLQQVFKVQSVNPFLLVDNLSNYLHMILKMLINNIPNKCYKNERLILTITQANLKIFTCFTYYMNTEEFQGSIYNRKNSNNVELQQKLHAEFLSVFTQENVTQILSKLITEVMVSRAINAEQKDIVDQEMILEETEVGSQDMLADSNAYEVAILLCKNILKCFKKELKPVLQSLFMSVGNFEAANNLLKQKIIQNTMQLILVLPKIYDEHELPLQHVMNLLQVLYANYQYAMLARLIKNYHQFLNHATLQNSFKILSQIVATPLTSPHVTIDIIYQSALTMKKILTEHDSEIFSFENFSPCIINLLQLLQNQKFTNTPTLMWPLIKLANQLLKLTNANALISDIGEKIIDCMFPVISAKNSQELTVCGLVETLMQLLNIICACFKSNYLSEDPTHALLTPSTVKILFASYTLIVNNIQNSNLENVDSLYMLWLCLVRNYPTIQQQKTYGMDSVQEVKEMNVKVRELFKGLFETVLEEDSVCAIQVLEEYLLCGLVQMNQQQLFGVFSKMLSNCPEEHKVRTYTALFSMYLCYLLVQQGENSGLQPDILKLLIQTLINYSQNITPQHNGLRTILMMLIDYCVVRFGAKNIFQLFSSWFQGNYTRWFKSYCSSLQYVSNRLCHKMNATTMLKAIEDLGAPTFGKMLLTQIDGNYPVDKVFQTMIISLDTIKISQAWTTFSNMYKLILPSESTASSVSTFSSIKIDSLTSRKVKLQLSGLVKEIVVSDQRPNFQKLVGELLTFWDWGEDDVMERFDKITSNEIVTLLRGNFNNDYDINEPD